LDRLSFKLRLEHQAEEEIERLAPSLLLFGCALLPSGGHLRFRPGERGRLEGLAEPGVAQACRREAASDAASNLLSGSLDVRNTALEKPAVRELPPLCEELAQQSESGFLRPLRDRLAE